METIKMYIKEIEDLKKKLDIANFKGIEEIKIHFNIILNLLNKQNKVEKLLGKRKNRD